MMKVDGVSGNAARRFAGILAASGDALRFIDLPHGADLRVHTANP
jgi:hypothetical protein